MRTIITGWPRAGKTVLAKETHQRHPGPLWHTDDLERQPWAAQATAVASWIERPGPFLIEGVSALRGLRKWHQQHPGEPPPIDRLWFLRLPDRLRRGLPSGQRGMGSGLETILTGLLNDWPALGPLLTERIPRFTNED